MEEEDEDEEEEGWSMPPPTTPPILSILCTLCTPSRGVDDWPREARVNRESPMLAMVMWCLKKEDKE